jgi:hypothetical protein
MRSKLVLAAAALATLCVAAQPSRAAESSLLVAAKGATPSNVDVLSWSWGTSHPVAAAAPSGAGPSAGTGKVSVQDISMVRSARESGSGMATGRRVAAADADVAPAPSVGDEVTLNVLVADTVAAAMLVGACASGEHLSSVSLSNAGSHVQLSDAVVTSCPVQSGQRLLGVRGHVTLIK